MTQYFQIRDFEQFLYRKDREPSSVKLPLDLAYEDRWEKLTDAERGHIVGLLFYAAGRGNRIPNDAGRLRYMIFARRPINLETFVNLGWLEPCPAGEPDNATAA